MKDSVITPARGMAMDHVAYLVRDTIAAMAALTRMGKTASVYRMPLANQRAYITILEAEAGGQKIELVEPFAENSIMWQRLNRAGQDSVLYHICYNVTDFDSVFRDLRRDGWMPLSKPFEGLNPGKRARHLYHPSLGVIEIAEVDAL